MKKILLYTLLAVSSLAMPGCEGENDKTSPMSVEAFNALYPKSNVLQWDTKPGYEIAEFRHNGNDAEAWFDYQGWAMTKTSVSYDQLPSAIRNRFERSEYSGWEINGIYRIERKSMEIVYVACVERNKVAYDLYFSETGILVKKDDVTSTALLSDRYLPQTMPDTVAKNLERKYRNASIYAVSNRKELVEIDFLSEQWPRKAVYLDDGTWVMTIGDIDPRSLPRKTVETVHQECPGYSIMEATKTQTPSLSYYTVECDLNGVSRTVYVDSKGKIANK